MKQDKIRKKWLIALFKNYEISKLAPNYYSITYLNGDVEVNACVWKRGHVYFTSVRTWHNLKQQEHYYSWELEN